MTVADMILGIRAGMLAIGQQHKQQEDQALQQLQGALAKFNATANAAPDELRAGDRRVDGGQPARAVPA